MADEREDAVRPAGGGEAGDPEGSSEPPHDSGEDEAPFGLKAATTSRAEDETPAGSPAVSASRAGGDAAEKVSGGTSAGPADAPARARPPAGPGRRLRDALAEPPEIPIEIPRSRLAAQSRRDFLLYAAGVAVTAAGAWWLLPDRTRARLVPGPARDRLDKLAARVGLTRERRERTLDRALTFDDDVAEALYSKDRRVRTYDRSEVTPLPNNYDGQTPGPEYLPTWSLRVSGLASGQVEQLTINRLLARFTLHEQVTRLVCVEGWSAVAWWGGIRFADFLAAFPPSPGARWAALRSSVNLDFSGNSDPYYVSIDLDTARHPQTLLATHQAGRPLTLAHGAPLRLLAPMKLGLKNIKAVTDIAYTAQEPPDYWNERGYSKYDGL
jgi:DMSO/TMAO reductase YedYZ molybdopterin-dependent catalytic subunit